MSAMTNYRIRVRGHLDSSWADWLGRVTFEYRGPDTIIHGPDMDQSALSGLFNKFRDLNLVLLSVERIESQGGPR